MSLHWCHHCPAAGPGSPGDPPFPPGESREQGGSEWDCIFLILLLLNRTGVKPSKQKEKKAVSVWHYSNSLLKMIQKPVYFVTVGCTLSKLSINTDIWAIVFNMKSIHKKLALEGDMSVFTCLVAASERFLRVQRQFWTRRWLGSVRWSPRACMPPTYKSPLIFTLFKPQLQCV